MAGFFFCKQKPEIKKLVKLRFSVWQYRAFVNVRLCKCFFVIYFVNQAKLKIPPPRDLKTFL